jgi:hypothetical protein
MKTFPFILFLLLVPAVLKAQRVQTGFAVNPALNYRLLRGGSAGFIDLFNEVEYSKFGYSTGVDVVLRPRAKWQIGMGLLYSRQGYRLQVPMTDENGTHAGDLRIAEHFDYLDLPVFLKLQPSVRRKKHSLYYLFGVTNSLFIGHQSILKNNPLNEPYQSSPLSVRRYQIGPFVGAGLHHQLNEKVSVDIGPQASMQLLNLWKGNSFLNRHLYTVGLNFRLAYTY